MLGVGAVDRGHAAPTYDFAELVFVVLQGAPDEAVGTHRRGLGSVAASLSCVTAASTGRTSVTSARRSVRIPLGSVANSPGSVAISPGALTAPRLVRSSSASIRVVASDDVVAIV